MLSAGILWLVLTLAFEFGFGYLQGNSWASMFAEYNIFKGRRVRVVIPLITLIVPYAMFRLLRR